MTEKSADLADFASVMNTVVDGWKSAMGMTFTKATATLVKAELEVGPQHLQPLKMVHGGVYAGMIESVASVGASIAALAVGNVAVGLENHTSFLHAVHGGTLHAVGRPLSSGRRTSAWEVDVSDENGRVVATGRVRLLVIPQPATPVELHPAQR